MSSAPAVSLFAEIELRRGKFLAQYKQFQNELKNLSSNSGTKAELQIPVRLAPDTQQKLDAALAKIVVKPINVPVNFVPSGMPGMPGGGGMPSAPGAMPGGMAALQQATGGGTGARGSTLGRWGRFIGPGLLLHEALRAVQIQQDYSNAMTRATGMGDLQGQLGAEHQLQSSVGSMPLLGQAASLIANYAPKSFSVADAVKSALIPGYAGKVFADGGQDRQAEIAKTELETEINDRKTKAMTALNKSLAGSNADAADVGASQEQRQANAVRRSRLQFNQAVGAAIDGIPADQRPTKEITAATAAHEKYITATADRQEIVRMMSVAGLQKDAGILAAGNAGNTDSAERLALDKHQKEREIELRKKSDREANVYRDEVAPREREELEDGIRRKREKAEGDSAAKIANMMAEADARVLHARGEAYAATETLLKHSVDARVAALNREADAEKDVTRAAQLRRQAIAAGAAGAREIAAFQELDTRHGQLEARQAASERGVAELDAGGHHRQAAHKALDDKYFEDADKIMREGGPGMQDRMKALDDRYAAKKAGLDHHDAISSEQRQLRTVRANADATGQRGIGELEEERVRLRHELEDAGGDFKQTREVQLEGRARLRALRRGLMPTVQFNDAEQFSHDMGNAIGGGMLGGGFNDLLNKTERELKAGNTTNDLPQVSGRLDRAAQKLDDAAKELGKNKVAVLDN